MVPFLSKLVLLISLSQFSITESKCFHPAIPSRGYYEPEQIHQMYEAGQKVYYICSNPYVLLGDQIRICRENGSWSGKVPFCDLPVDVLSSSVQTSLGTANLATDGDTTTCSATLSGGKESWTGYLNRIYFVFAVRILTRGPVHFNFRGQITRDKSIHLYGNFSASPGEENWKFILCKQNANMIYIYNTEGYAVKLCEIQFFAWNDKNYCTSPPDIDVVENGQLFVNRNNATLKCHGNYVPKHSSLIHCINNVWEIKEFRCKNDGFKKVQKGNEPGNTDFTIGVVGAVAIALGIVCLTLVIIILVRKRQWAETIMAGCSTTSTRTVGEDGDQPCYDTIIYSDIPDDTHPETNSNHRVPGSKELPLLPTATLDPEYCVPPASQLDLPCCVYSSTDHIPPYDDTEPQDAYRTPSGKCFGHAQCSYKSE